MILSRRVFLGLALAFLASAAGASAGEILVGNLDQPPVTDPGYLIYIDGTNFPAQQFTTAGWDVELTSIVASLGDLDPGTGGDFSVEGRLYSDNGTQPGSLLATFLPVTLPTSGYAGVEFLLSSPLALAANTSYWFELRGSSSDGTGSIYWQYTLSTDRTGPGTLPNSGITYADPSNPGWQGSAPNEPFLIQISVVPEPSALTLAAIALGVSALAARARGRLPLG
jgi:hypothetical protein